MLGGSPVVSTPYFPPPSILFDDCSAIAGTNLLGSGLSLDQRDLQDPSSLSAIPKLTEFKLDKNGYFVPKIDLDSEDDPDQDDSKR